MKAKRPLLFVTLLGSFCMSSCSLSDFVNFYKIARNYINQNVFDLEEQEQSVDDVPVSPTEVENKYKFTVMYYMCGSTLEYDESMGFPGDKQIGNMTDDINEILSVNYPSDVKVIIETGGSKKWCATPNMLDGAFEISSRHLQRWEVTNHRLKLVSTLDSNQMASKTSFEAFLKWGLRDYPAERVGVILSGHGAGIGGCAFDDNSYFYRGLSRFQNYLDTEEVARASKNALYAYSREKFTFIGYDSCLMACADIATINSDYYEYMIASQESEDSVGWYQDIWLKKLAINPNISTISLLEDISTSFVNLSHQQCPNEYFDGIYNCNATLSVFDLSKINSLVETFNSYAWQIRQTSSFDYVNAFKNSYNELGSSCYGLADFKSFLLEMNKLYAFDTSEIENAIDNVIVINNYCSNIECALCGMNVFFPFNMSDGFRFGVAKADYTGVYKTKFNNWQALCLGYTAGWEY